MATVEVETFQNPWELEQLVAVFNNLGVHVTLEIGAWHGGTLRHWLKPIGSEVVVIDDAMRESHDWQHWAAQTQSTLYTLQGLSQDPEIIRRAAELGPYQFIFIDGDHTYSAVKSDWENYREMLSDGGAVAFHDIIPRPGYGVSEVWSEIKSQPGARWMEIAQTVEPFNESRCGIGIVWP